MKETNPNLEKEAQNSIIGMLKDLESLKSRYETYENNINQSLLTENDKLCSKIDASMSVIEGLGARLIMSFASEEEIQDLIDSLHSAAKTSRQLLAAQKDKDNNFLSVAKTEAALKGFVLPTSRGGPSDELNRYELAEEEFDIALNATKNALLAMSGKNIPPKEYATKFQEEYIKIIQNENKFDENKINAFRKFAAQGVKSKQDKGVTTEERKILSEAAVKACGEFKEIFAANEKKIKVVELANISFNNAAFLTNYQKLTSLSFLSNYQVLRQELANNVRAIYNNGSTSGLQNAFQMKGSLHSVINMLAEKEQKSKEVLENINKLPLTEENKSQKQEIINNATKELEEIRSLQSQLSSLSSAIGGARGNFAARKAINNFCDGLEQHKEVKQGFFGTLFSTIYNAFVPKKPEQLESSKLALQGIKDRFNTEINSINSSIIFAKTPEVEKTHEKTVEIPQKTLSPDVPPPPPPPPILKQAPNNVLDEIKQKQQGRGDKTYNLDNINAQAPIVSKTPRDNLLDQIRQGAKLKPTEKTEIAFNISRDQAPYKYVSTKIEDKTGDNILFDALNKKMNNEQASVASLLLDGMTSEVQKNILYSAMLDNNKDLVKDLLSHQSLVATGEMDEFDEYIKKEGPTFSVAEIKDIEAKVQEASIRIESQKQKIIEERNKPIAETSIEIKQKAPSQNILKQPPPAPIPDNIDIPPPPSPMETEKKKPSHVSKLGERPERKEIGMPDMLKDIKEAKLKPSTKAVDMNIDGFTYIPEIGLEKKSDQALISDLIKRRESIDPEEQVKNLMKGKDEQAKLDTLYSAVINGNVKLVDNIIEYGSAKVFSKQNCQKIYNAAKEITESINPTKKIIIERGMETLAQEAKLDVQKSSVIDR